MRLAFVVGVVPAATALPHSVSAASTVPAQKDVDSFTRMTGRVVRSSSKKITIDFFPTGSAEGQGLRAYDAEVELSLDKAASLTTVTGAPVTRLSVYKTGTLITVTGHVDPYDHKYTQCNRVNGFVSCTTRTEERYRYWIDSITTDGGRCTQSRKIRVEVPWARNHDTRALVCVAGANAFAYLSRWDGIRSAALHVAFPGQSFDLSLTDGAITKFTLASSVPLKTTIKGRLVYDVADDGRDGYTADLGRLRL